MRPNNTAIFSFPAHALFSSAGRRVFDETGITLDLAVVRAVGQTTEMSAGFPGSGIGQLVREERWIPYRHPALRSFGQMSSQVGAAP